MEKIYLVVWLVRGITAAAATKAHGGYTGWGRGAVPSAADLQFFIVRISIFNSFSHNVNCTYSTVYAFFILFLLFIFLSLFLILQIFFRIYVFFSLPVLLASRCMHRAVVWRHCAGRPAVWHVLVSCTTSICEQPKPTQRPTQPEPPTRCVDCINLAHVVIAAIDA